MITIPKEMRLSRATYDAALEQVRGYHGHLCPGIYLGTKVSLLAQEILGYRSFPDKDLIVIVEIDRCLADAITSITGCRVGKRTLKLRDWGRFAATFCSLAHSQGVRIASRSDSRKATEDEMKRLGIDPFHDERAAGVYFDMPYEQQFTFQVKDVVWDENDLPGFPRVKVTCAACGERVMDNRHRSKGDRDYCQPCAKSLA